MVHNIPCYNNSYNEKMAKKANDKIVSGEIKKVKTDIEHINDPNEELVNAEAEKFLLLFEKTFFEHLEKTLKEENIEKKSLDSEDGIVSDILTKIAKEIRGTIHSEEAREKVNKVRKFLKIIDSFFHSILTANEMAKKPPNNFDNRRFAVAKEIANASRRNNRFKIKFVLLQGKDGDVKLCGNVIRMMRVRRRAIFPALLRNRQY